MTLFDYRHERERFDARAAELGVSEHVRVLGPLGREELDGCSALPTCSRSPRSRRASGSSRSRRWRPGCRSSPSDLDVFRGFLTDGESALLAPVGDAAALAAALERVARERAARRLRAGGRRSRRAHLGRGGGRARARLRGFLHAEASAG